MSRFRSLLRPHPRFARVFTRLTLLLMVAYLIFVLFFGATIRVSGTSMEPTLTSDDLILCVKPKEIHNGDIVVFRHNDKTYIKRVAGHSYETVYYNEQNGTPNRIVVPEDSFFMLGDNTPVSIDSRFFGAIPKTEVLYKYTGYKIKTVYLMIAGGLWIGLLLFAMDDLKREEEKKDADKAENPSQ